MRWLHAEGKALLSAEIRPCSPFLTTKPGLPTKPTRGRCVRSSNLWRPITFSKHARQRPAHAILWRDSHLGNGASLERINWLGDTSAKDSRNRGHHCQLSLRSRRDREEPRGLSNQGVIAASSAVKRLLRSGGRIRPPEANGGAQEKLPAAKAKAKTGDSLSTFKNRNDKRTWHPIFSISSRAASLRTDKVFIETLDNRKITYGDLLDGSARFANALVKLGVVPAIV